MKIYTTLTFAAAALTLIACSADPEIEPEQPEPEQPEPEQPTYYADTKAIIDAKCGTCHQPGQIGPFPLTTIEEIQSLDALVRESIESGSMPPWQPSEECNTFEDNFDLTPHEKALLLTWLDTGAPAGDPADEPKIGATVDHVTLDTDINIRLPEAYVPQYQPDDYRCQLIEWPAEETRYVTGVQVTPDQGDIVHHVIVFLVGPDQADRFRAYDEAEEGPGYTCYGGPTANGSDGMPINLGELVAVLDELGITLQDLQSGNITDDQRNKLITRLGVGGGYSTLGSWVPGVPNTPYPAGTGIRVEPGSMLVVQMHYNTLKLDPVPDQSMIGVATTDSVDREATVMMGVDLGWVTNGMFGDPMTIPAGDAKVEHSTIVEFESLFTNRARQQLGLEPGSPLVIHTANHHMHELGTRQRSELRRTDGETSCLLDIRDWDFSWQGSYTFEESVRFGPGDKLWMGCTWDNSAANQPVIDGAMRTPTDVTWGEGTADEMCLSAYYVTGE